MTTVSTPTSPERMDRTGKDRYSRNQIDTPDAANARRRHHAQGNAQATLPTDAVALGHSRQSARSSFDGFCLEKAFVLFGFIVAALLISLFGLDLIVGWPFKRASALYDVSNVLGGLALSYLSWDAMRDGSR